MTIAPERPAVRRRPGWDETSLLSAYSGVRWWIAVCLALALTTVGVFADIHRLHRLGIFFQACYFLGCLLAVTVVQRKGLFGPMVQPPLVLTITVPSVVLLAGSLHTGGGTTAAALAIGTPLINGFPTMAITTVAALAVGIFRWRTQRRPATQSHPDARLDVAPAADPFAKPVRTSASERVRTSGARTAADRGRASVAERGRTPPDERGSAPAAERGPAPNRRRRTPPGDQSHPAPTDRGRPTRTDRPSATDRGRPPPVDQNRTSRTGRGASSPTGQGRPAPANPATRQPPLGQRREGDRGPTTEPVPRMTEQALKYEAERFTRRPPRS